MKTEIKVRRMISKILIIIVWLLFIGNIAYFEVRPR